MPSYNASQHGTKIHGTPANGRIISYNSSNGRWEVATSSSGDSVTTLAGRADRAQKAFTYTTGTTLNRQQDGRSFNIHFPYDLITSVHGASGWNVYLRWMFKCSYTSATVRMVWSLYDTTNSNLIGSDQSAVGNSNNWTMGQVSWAHDAANMPSDEATLNLGFYRNGGAGSVQLNSFSLFVK